MNDTASTLREASDVLHRINFLTTEMGGINTLAEKLARQAGGHQVPPLTRDEANVLSWSLGLFTLLTIAAHQQGEYEDELAERFASL